MSQVTGEIPVEVVRYLRRLIVVFLALATWGTLVFLAGESSSATSLGASSLSQEPDSPVVTRDYSGASAGCAQCGQPSMYARQSTLPPGSQRL